MYDAVVARYSSPPTAALGRLILPYLFTKLSAFATLEDLVTHLRTSVARYRAALPTEFLEGNPPLMYITLYFIVTRLPDSLRAVRDHFLALDPTDLTNDLLEQYLLAAETSVVAVSAARGTPRTPFFEGMSGLLLLFVGSPAAARARVAGVVAVAAKVVVVAAVEVVEVAEVVAAVGVVAGVGAFVAAVVAAVGVAVVAAVGVVAVGVGLVRGEVLAVARGSSVGARPLRPRSFATALGASESALPGTAPAKALHTFTLESSASRCFFRNSTTLTPLFTPVLVRLVDPSRGPILAHSSTVLPCPAVPSGSLSGLHLPSFSTNLVSTAALQDAMVTTTTPGGQHVSICTCTRTGRHLATFTRRPGSSLYTLATEPPQVVASAQVSASGLVSPPCSCCLLSHQTLLWHHRLGHPSLSRFRGMHSRLLIFGLPRSLPPLPPSPAPPCLPCIEGRQRAAPHSSSFLSTTAPLQNLLMDVWGLACVSGQGRERYFLLVVDDYTRYTTVFPLCSKGEVPDVLIPWIHAVRLQLRERFRQNLPILRLHSNRGGEFSSDLFIGLVMEVARTSMIHAATPHFLWSFAVRYAAYQLNLWPHKLSFRAIPCVFLGFPPDAPGWQFYHPTSHRVLPSQDVTIHKSIPFYRPFPYLSAPLPPPPLFLAPGPPSVYPLLPQGPAPSVAVRGTASGGAASGGAEPASAEPGGAEPAGVEPRGAEYEGAEPRGPEHEGAEPEGTESEDAQSGGAKPRGNASSGGPAGSAAGGTGAGGAGATSLGGARVPAGTGGTEGAGAAGLGGARTRGTGAAEAGGVGGAGAGGAPAGDPGVGGAGAGGTGARGTGAGGAGARGAGAVDLGAGGAGAGGAASSGTGARGTVQRRPFFVPPPPSSLPPPDSVLRQVLNSPSKRREPASRPASPVCAIRTGHRVPRSRPPPVPGTHVMALPRAASPTIPRLLATVVTDPSFESTAAYALVAELVDLAAACRLDYATSLVAGSESDYPPSVGDPDAPDIPTPRSYAKAITSPYSCHSKKSMDAEMASWKYTGTYVDAVPPSGANIVDGMWILRGNFLQGILHEEIWLRRLPGFTWSFPAGTQWSLRRPVYGLREAPREWHDKLRTTLAALGFFPWTADPSLFLRTDTSLPSFYVLLYVDDLVFVTADTEALALVNSKLQKRYTFTDLGELRNYLGLQITRDRARRTITRTRSHVVHQALQRFGFRYSSLQSTALPTGRSLLAPPSVDTSGMGLVLGGRGLVVLAGRADASWVDALATQRSSQGYTLSLGSGFVSWRSIHSSSQRGQLRLAYVAIRADSADIFTKALQSGYHKLFSTVLGLLPTLPHLLNA
ncbi:unnamed protein product [Closterium sp. NIES-53]